MHKKTKQLGLAIVVLACATPAIAQDVPPPSAATEEAIIAWAKAAKIADDTTSPKAAWNMVGATDDGLLMAAVEPKDAAGIAKVGIRLERFKPAGGRSEASMFDLDCGKQLIKATLDASYGDHNLTGAKQDRPLNGAWAPVASNDLVNQLKNDACSASVAAAPAAATRSAVNIQDPNAVREWIRVNGILDKNVGRDRSAQWTIIKATDEGVVYSTLANSDTTTRIATMVVRLERFAPANNAKLQATLSDTTDWEINCTNSRIRKTGSIAYAQHNLGGSSDGARKIEDWAPVAQHPLLSKVGTDFCREFQVQRKFIN